MSVLFLRRWSQDLDMKPIENTVVQHVLWHGRDLRWTMYTGTNLAVAIAHARNKNSDHLRQGLKSLEKRGWIRRGVNDAGQRYIKLTTEFVAACELESDRADVRKALGPITWQKINGNDEIADELHAMTLEMTPEQKYKDRVKAAAAILIAGVGRSRSSASPQLARSEPTARSQRADRSLKLIKGERKYGP